MKMDKPINFVSNNVKGLSTSKTKRLKIFLHLKDIIKNNGFIFLQETHSTKTSSNAYKEDFGKNNNLFFSHGASNARGVAIGICGDFEYTIKNEVTDHHGRFLILVVEIGNSNFALINFYNENNQKDQLRLLNELDAQINQLALGLETKIILAGDFNFYFDKNLEAKGGNPQTKTQSIAKFLNIKEKYDLCDIWRIRNDKEKNSRLDKDISLVISKDV